MDTGYVPYTIGASRMVVAATLQGATHMPCAAQPNENIPWHRARRRPNDGVRASVAVDVDRSDRPEADTAAATRREYDEKLDNLVRSRSIAVQSPQIARDAGAGARLSIANNRP